MRKHNNVRILAAIITAALGQCLPSYASPVDLIVNGSFENNGELVGTTVVQGWNVFGLVDILGSSAWAPKDGLYSLDLNGGRISTITQDISVPDAGLYQLSFWYSGKFSDYLGEDINKAFFFHIDKTSGDLNGQPEWKFYSQLINLEQTDYTLIFASQTAGANGPILDQVSLTLIPEPFHYSLASTVGVLGLLISSRLRKK